MYQLNEWHKLFFLFISFIHLEYINIRVEAWYNMPEIKIYYVI